MFKREVLPLSAILQKLLRQEGLETPLLQKRLIDAWGQVVGAAVERYTAQKFIKDQVLWVKIQNPALRQDLTMMRSQLVKRLNAAVGADIITDIRFY